MTIDVRASGNDFELWHVQLPGGDVRTLSLDELDAAFQAGTIDERTLVLKAGTLQWATLGAVAGIEEQPNSLAPFAADVAVNVSVPPLPLPDILPVPVSLDTAELAAFRPKRRVGRALAAVATVALVGGAFFGVARSNVPSIASLTSLVTGKLSGNPSDSPMESARSAVGAMPGANVPETSAPPPEPAESVPATQPTSAGISIDALPSAAAAQESKPAKDSKSPKKKPAKRRQGKGKARKSAGSDPTLRGSGQFDPLDGAL